MPLQFNVPPLPSPPLPSPPLPSPPLPSPPLPSPPLPSPPLPSPPLPSPPLPSPPLPLPSPSPPTDGKTISLESTYYPGQLVGVDPDGEPQQPSATSADANGTFVPFLISEVCAYYTLPVADPAWFHPIPLKPPHLPGHPIRDC